MSKESPSISRKGLPESRSAVHRPAAAGPSTGPSQIEGSHEEDAHQHMPPPYSGPTNPSLIPSTTPRTKPYYPPGAPTLDYSLYGPPTFTLSPDKITTTTHHPQYSTSPAALVRLIQQVATVPPKPIVRITGRNSSGLADFDIKINLMNLFVPPGEAKRGLNYVKIIGAGEVGWRGDYKETTKPHVEGGLEKWAKRFCEDGSAVKQFALTRTTTNFDANYVEGRILALISSLKYRGNVTVTFPTTHSRVLIHSPDKINRFFSDITGFFTGTKRYEVVESVWPFADGVRGEEGRKCEVMDEEGWFQAWKGAIKWAAVSGRKGWVTVEDWLEGAMEPGEVKVVEWGAGTVTR